jgi:hypothetical protein
MAADRLARPRSEEWVRTRFPARAERIILMRKEEGTRGAFPAPGTQALKLFAFNFCLTYSPSTLLRDITS